MSAPDNLRALFVEVAAEVEVDEDAGVTAPDGHRLTDAGNAARFVELMGDCVRYVHEWQRWIVYGGGRWAVDGGDALVMERAKAVGDSLFRQVPKAPTSTRDAVYTAAKRAESCLRHRRHGPTGPWP